MLKKTTLITLFMFAGLLSAASKPAETPKVDDVKTSLQSIDKELGIGSVVPATENKDVVVAKQEAPAPKKTEKVDGPIYHYAYVPDEQGDDAYDFEVGTMAGHRGNFILSFIGEGVVYKGYNVGKPGFEAELGWQFNLFKYLSLLTSVGGGFRKGNTSGKNLLPLGAKAALRFRLLPWLFPYAEGGVECIKVTHAGWEPPSKVFGGGLLIRIGYADRKAEYNLYKLVNITRTMLILGFDYVKTPHHSVEVPNMYLFKGGLSFEF